MDVTDNDCFQIKDVICLFRNTSSFAGSRLQTSTGQTSLGACIWKAGNIFRKIYCLMHIFKTAVCNR